MILSSRGESRSLRASFLFLGGVLAAACAGMSAGAAQPAPAEAEPESILIKGKRETSAVVLDKPVLTGSRLGIDAFDLPASVSVVSHELIQLRGARTALEAIEGAVGMTGGTQAGSIPFFATRGFTGNDVTIMRDGIRQNTTAQSSRPLDSFLFESIEVLKGPASLLYGEGAVGGAINYVSKLPDERFRGEAFASAGSWNTQRYGLGLGGPTGIEGLSYRADVSHNRSDGFVDGSGFEYTAAAGSLRYAFSERASVTVQGTYLKDDVESYFGTPLLYDAVINQNGVQSIRRANAATDTLVNARIDERSRRLNYNNFDNFVQARNGFGRVLVEAQLSDAWSLRNETYVATQRLNWRNTENTVWNPVTQRVDRATFSLVYRDDLQLGTRLDLKWTGLVAGRPNTLVLGGFYDDNEQNRNSGQVIPGSPSPANVPLLGFDRGIGPAAFAQRTVQVDTVTAAAYLEDVLDVTDRVKLVGGLRYDGIDVRRLSFVGAPLYEQSYDPLTGRLGVIFSASPDLNLYASYSQAAQPVIQLVSLTVSQDDFALQKGVQFEIGAKASLGIADVTLALFDIEKQDLLTSTIIDGVRLNSQIGAQVSQGAELAAAFQLPHRWRIDTQLAWTWQAEFRDFNDNVGTGVISRAGNTPPNVPELVAGVFVAKTLGAWQFTGGARYVSDRQANNNNGIQLDSYTLIDASVGYRWNALDITLRGRNLANERYADWAAAAGLTLRLADPRNAELSLRYTF